MLDPETGRFQRPPQHGPPALVAQALLAHVRRVGQHDPSTSCTGLGMIIPRCLRTASSGGHELRVAGRRSRPGSRPGSSAWTSECSASTRSDRPRTPRDAVRRPARHPSRTPHSTRPRPAPPRAPGPIRPSDGGRPTGRICPVGLEGELIQTRLGRSAPNSSGPPRQPPRNRRRARPPRRSGRRPLGRPLCRRARARAGWATRPRVPWSRSPATWRLPGRLAPHRLAR